MKNTKIETLIQLQTWITDLNKDNVSQVTDQIKSSIYFKDSYSKLFHEIVCSLQIRPKSIDLYAQLIISLFEKEGVKDSFIKYSFIQPNSKNQTIQVAKYALLRKIIDFEGITITEILPNIQRIIENRCVFVKSIINLLFFGQYLRKESEELYAEIIKAIKAYSFKLATKSSYYSFAEKIEDFDDQQIAEMTEYFCAKDSLAYALRYDDEELLKKLASADGFDFDATIGALPFEICPLARKNPSLLSFAALFNSEKCVKYLLENGASVDSIDRNYDGVDAYFAAAGNIEFISNLPECFSLINSLQKAAEYRNTAIVEFIIESAKDSDDYADQLLQTISSSASSNSASTLLSLLNNKEIEDKPSTLELIDALAIEGHTLLFESLIDECTIGQQEADYLLLDAIKNNSIDIVNILINKYKASPNTKDDENNALYYCITEGFEELTNMLLDNESVDINAANSEGTTPLIAATSIKSSQLVEKLIAKHAELNAKDSKGLTALMHAIIESDEKSVGILINNGALIEVDGISALHNAAETDNANILSMILEKRPNLEVKDSEGKTPLHRASAANLIENVKLLVEAGSDVNAKDETGSTPLHHATGNQSNDVIKYLCSLPNIDKNIVDKSGWTPLRIAELQCQEQEIINILK